MPKRQKILQDLVRWEGNEEIDLYPYFRDFFVAVLGYPKNKVRINERGEGGKPDISLLPGDATSDAGISWVVGEIKKERGFFRSDENVRSVWERQASRYVTPDTVYVLLADPTTIVVLLPNGDQFCGPIKLDEVSVDDLLSIGENSLLFLHYENSLSDQSLEAFKEGRAPEKYIDVRTREGAEKFNTALRVSAEELINYATKRINSELEKYEEYIRERESIEKLSITPQEATNRIRELESRYEGPIRLVREIIPEFENQIGKQLPTGADAQKFIRDAFATEAASLVLSRILFVRFAEDHGLMTRKISNGGIKQFREFLSYIKDDYRKLLELAYQDASHIYSGLFEESVFDWGHKGDGKLSKILLRIFYRLNAFDFRHITGDILGNLYEKFLDKAKRKKLGEFYTPQFIVDYLIEATGAGEDLEPFLDPACGSGTFVIRCLEKRLKRLRERGVQSDVALETAANSVAGLDINMFAAFIAQLQVIWRMFPLLKRTDGIRIPPLKIHGGINSLVFEGQRTLHDSIFRRPQEALRIRDSEYQYVLGNPPYIRNERLRDRGEWREFYRDVDVRNSDIAFFFVQRALYGGRRLQRTKMGEQYETRPPWIKKGGKLGFVLSLGFANSEAARELRERILKKKVLEIVDLEMVSGKIFDAAVNPMLIVVEQDDAPPDWKIKVRAVTMDHVKDGILDIKSAPASEIEAELFRPNEINPFGYFLTKIQSDDIPVLKKLMLGSKRVEDYARITPRGDKGVMYGLKLGRGLRPVHERKPEMLPVGKGTDISTFYADQGSFDGYVNPAEVSIPYLWRYREWLPEVGYVFSELGLSIQSAKFNPQTFAFNNSAIIFIPNEETKAFPWDAFFNSSVSRFVFLTCLRSASLAGSLRSHIYPRTVRALPVPEEIFNLEKELTTLAEKLRELAEKISNRWKNIEEEIQNAETKKLAEYPIDFRNWSGTAYGSATIKKRDDTYLLTAITEEGQASPFFIEGEYELLNVVKYLLGDVNEINPRRLQTLEVPVNYRDISRMIDEAADSESPIILRFKEVLKEVDKIIADSFGLKEEDLEYIEKRLSTPPFSELQPRWPWTPVKRRPIVTYHTDRFA
jgi:type I restriction-modification system DNA methylase subunit